MSATIVEPEAELLGDGPELDRELPELDGFAPEGPEAEPEILSLRPVLASALATSAAALVVGGIFDSWAARLFNLVVAAGSAALVVWVLRSKRPALAQLAFPLILVVAAVMSVVPGGSPNELSRHVREALDAARLLQIPIPFDPGWRPVLTIVFGLLGFGSAWVGAAMKRPMLGVVLPVPLVAVAAISQPTSAQVLAGVFAFLPILAAFGVLFGAEAGVQGAGLGRQFELTRILRGGAGMAGLAALLVVLGQTSFLFPKPVYDPNDRPQKPKSVPLSQQRDRVLLTVKAPAGFTGPWRTNVLDVYEDGAWKLPGLNPSRLSDLPGDGVLSDEPTSADLIDVTLTTGDLGATAVVPVVPTARRVRFAGDHPELKLDLRAGTLRVPAGRAPKGLTYTLSLPRYPTAKELAIVPKVTGSREFLEVPPAPIEVQRLLAKAPPGPWEKLDYVRRQLLDDVTAKGAGSPKELTPKRVVDMLQGSKKGTPFEIVAAQALLARWAGVPSRIGVGFNDLNAEDGTFTVRPKNAAQWLEVRFDGYGWIPLLDVPPQAQADLENKEKDNDRILPSTDIAAQVYVPIAVRNPKLLFEKVRAVLLQLLPVAALLLLTFLGAPGVAKAVRRRRREGWAEPLGPRARVAVAYAELRDAATDLSVGDPFATPIEYLDRVEEDAEHREMAWLVTRVLYGDMALDVTEEDARMAEEMGMSLQRRLRQAQPMQVRAVAFLSRASVTSPFSDEVPNVSIPTPLRSLRLTVDRALHRTTRVLSRRGSRPSRPVEEVAR